MKTVVLISGGMDSVTLLHHVAERHQPVAALSFRYGSKHNDKEIPFAKAHADRIGVEHHVIDLDFIPEHFHSNLLKGAGEVPDGHYTDESMKKTVVPFRNGIMLAAACGFAESIQAEALAIAAHSGDHSIYPDCREPFMEAMGEAMRAGTYAGIELLRPFVHMDKAAIAKRGAELGVDFAESWSCYKGGDTHCGTCGTCVERREAFMLAGLKDPTEYLVTPSLPSAPVFFTQD